MIFNIIVMIWVGEIVFLGYEPKNSLLAHFKLFQGPKNSTGGSPYFTHGWTFENNKQTSKRPALEFPAVPYGPDDFHCERNLGDWGSAFQLNYGIL